MNKHTPTPWQIGKYHSVVSDSPVPEMRGSDDVYHYGGHMVCESVTADNAAHIVRCVNSHEALVNALEAYQQAYAMPTYGDASDFVFPKITMRVPGNHAWGHECEKHGVGYGAGCICCRDDFNRHAKNKDQQECNKRDEALREASRLAKAALAAAGAPQ